VGFGEEPAGAGAVTPARGAWAGVGVGLRGTPTARSSGLGLLGEVFQDRGGISGCPYKPKPLVWSLTRRWTPEQRRHHPARRCRGHLWGLPGHPKTPSPCSWPLGVFLPSSCQLQGGNWIAGLE